MERKTIQAPHVDIIENYEHRTWHRHVALAVRPSFSPTERVHFEDIPTNFALRRYLEAFREDVKRLKNFRRASWIETLREISENHGLATTRERFALLSGG